MGRGWMGIQSHAAIVILSGLFSTTRGIGSAGTGEGRVSLNSEGR
jgi:hypothetical protein